MKAYAEQFIKLICEDDLYTRVKSMLPNHVVTYSSSPMSNSLTISKKGNDTPYIEYDMSYSGRIMLQPDDETANPRTLAKVSRGQDPTHLLVNYALQYLK